MLHRQKFGHFSFHRRAKSYVYSSCVGTLACCAGARLHRQFCPPSEPLRDRTKVKGSGRPHEFTRDQRHQSSSLWQKSEGDEERFCPLMLFGVRSSVFNLVVNWWDFTGGPNVLWGGLWPVKGSSRQATFAVAEPLLGVASRRLIVVTDKSKVWWLLKRTRNAFLVAQHQHLLQMLIVLLPLTWLAWRGASGCWTALLLGAGCFCSLVWRVSSWSFRLDQCRCTPDQSGLEASQVPYTEYTWS